MTDKLTLEGLDNSKNPRQNYADELEQENAKLRDALKWVGQVYPGKSAHGGAIVYMTWEEWGALRDALGLYPQLIRRSASETVKINQSKAK